jgi:hypothetical protein
MTKSLADMVQEAVYSDPLLSYSLSAGIANYSAVAKRLIPALERSYGAPVRVNSVVQALKRVSVREAAENYERIASLLGAADYSVIQGVTELSLPPGKLGDVLRTLSALDEKDVKLMIIFSVNGWHSLITDERTSSFLSLGDVAAPAGTSMLSIALPKTTEGLPGVTAFVAQLLSRNGVRIRNIVRSGNRIYVLFRREDTRRTFEALTALQAHPVKPNTSE